MENGKFQSSVEHKKNWPSMAMAIKKAEILNELERERRLRRTDRQTDSRTVGRNVRRQYPSSPIAFKGKNGYG